MSLTWLTLSCQQPLRFNIIVVAVGLRPVDGSLMLVTVEYVPRGATIAAERFKLEDVFCSDRRETSGN
jgi:hypothetical protein